VNIFTISPTERGRGRLFPDGYLGLFWDGLVFVASAKIVKDFTLCAKYAKVGRTLKFLRDGLPFVIYFTIESSEHELSCRFVTPGD